jgi:hypothetical protein
MAERVNILVKQHHFPVFNNLNKPSINPINHQEANYSLSRRRRETGVTDLVGLFDYSISNA